MAIAIVAFLARVIFLLDSPDRDWPHSIFYEGDAVMWVEWAAQIDQRLPFQFDLPIHPPAIAYTLAYAYDGIRTSGVAGMKILWCAMSAGACALTFLACAPMLGRRVALIAALLLAFSFNQYVLATSINSETPYVFLVPAMVLLTQRAIDCPNRWLLAVLGALHGFALLLRPEHPVLMLFFGVWMLIAHPRRAIDASFAASAPSNRLPLRARLMTIALMGIAALLVSTPWTVHAVLATQRFNQNMLGLTRIVVDEGDAPATIRFDLAPLEWSADAQSALNDLPAFAREENFIVLNHWAQRQRLQEVTAADVTRFFIEQFGWIPQPLSPVVFVSNQGPFSFALANHPQADGGFSRAALAHPMRGSDPTFACAFPPHNRVFTDGWGVGWRYIRDDPATWVRNAGRKFQRFADGITCGFGAANLPLGREGVRAAVDMFVGDPPMARWWQLIMLALIVAGMIIAMARRMPAALWLMIIVYKVIVTLAFYGYVRQAASIAPAFFVIIAIALDTMLLLVDRRWRGLMKWSALIAAVLCAGMLASDVVLSRRNERITIVGKSTPRPDLGPGAFQAFNRIEIRAAP